MIDGIKSNFSYSCRFWHKTTFKQIKYLYIFFIKAENQTETRYLKKLQIIEKANLGMFAIKSKNMEEMDSLPQANNINFNTN